MPRPLCTQVDLLHTLQGEAHTASVEPDRTLEIGEHEVWERKWESLKAILQAYRFTGTLSSDLSGSLISSELVC